MTPVFAKGIYKGRSPRETRKVFEGTPSLSLSYLAEKTMFFHQLFCSISRLFESFGIMFILHGLKNISINGFGGPPTPD